MATLPEMRVLIQTTFEADWDRPVIRAHPKPYDHPSNGGPPEVLQHAGVEQIIIIREDSTTVYAWVTLKLIPDMP